VELYAGLEINFLAITVSFGKYCLSLADIKSPVLTLPSEINAHQKEDLNGVNR